MYVDGVISQDDRTILDLLRAYRKKNIIVSEVETNEGNDKYPQILGLSDFLKRISFPCAENKLSKLDVQYLTGGWFEEYVYHLLSEKIQPTDIQIGVEIQKSKSTNINDLDVAFTKGNKLWVIECKTGVGTESLFNQIVYKASALKEKLLGLSAKSYIFSLNPPLDDRLKITASNMNTNYVDLSDFQDSEKMDKLFASIINQSY